MDWIITGIIAGIAVLLAAQRSSYLVDYVVFVYVFNRGLRRLIDYTAGSFNPFSPISLTPLIVTGVMLLPFLQRFYTLPKVHKTIFYCLFFATGYAFIIGFFRIQFAAVYALGEVTGANRHVWIHRYSGSERQHEGSVAALFRMVRDSSLGVWMVSVFYHSAVGRVLGASGGI